MVAVTVDSIQTGTETVTSGDGTSIDVTITSVNTSRSVVMFTTRTGEDSRDKRALYAASLTSSTNINFLRTDSAFASTATIEWTVIEFATGVLSSLQTISADWYTTTSNTITAVDTSESIIIWSRRTNQNVAFTQGEAVNLEFNGAGTAVLASGLTAASKGIGEAQVLEFDGGVDVQHFMSNLAENVESDTETITSVDAGSSFISSLGFDALRSVSGDIGRYHPIIELTNATTVSFSRSTVGSVDPELDISYSVVELQDGQTVESFNTTISDTNTTPTSQPTFTEVGADSVIFSGTQLLPTRGDNSNTAALGSFAVSALLDDPPDGVTLTRIDSSKAIDIEGFVIDFTASGGGPQVINESVGFGFSASLVNADVTVEVETFPIALQLAVQNENILEVLEDVAISFDLGFEANGGITLNDGISIGLETSADNLSQVAFKELLNFGFTSSVSASSVITALGSIQFVVVSDIGVADAAIIQEQVSLGLINYLDVADNISVLEAVNFPVNTGVHAQDYAQVVAAITMGLSTAISVITDGDTIFNEQIGVGLNTGIGVNDDIIATEQITIDIDKGLTIDGMAIVEDGIAYNLSLNYSNQDNAALVADITIGLQHGLIASGQMSLQEAMTLGFQMAHTITDTIGGLKPNSRRTITLGARNKTKVTGNSRIVTVSISNRKIDA